MTVLKAVFRALAAGTVVLAPALSQAAADEYGAIREKLELCASCHGPNGASTQPQYPILAGQHYYYLYVQLKDFKSGLRASEEMKPIVADLGKEHMQAMAKFFSEQKWPRTGYASKEADAVKGERATVAGECVQCHRGGYEGDSRIPRLAGQHRQYLNKTLMDFKTKKRNNSPSKSSLMQTFDEADIAAMAEFLAGL